MITLKSLFLRLLLNAVVILALGQLLSGVTIDSYLTALVVAAILAFLNSFVKPILVILTLPITIFTLGIFLLFVNAFIILITVKLVDGFYVENIWWAILFSVLLAILQSFLHKTLLNEGKNKLNTND
jgi:putative membrane protein